MFKKILACTAALTLVFGSAAVLPQGSLFDVNIAASAGEVGPGAENTDTPTDPTPSDPTDPTDPPAQEPGEDNQGEGEGEQPGENPDDNKGEGEGEGDKPEDEKPEDENKPGETPEGGDKDDDYKPTNPVDPTPDDEKPGEENPGEETPGEETPGEENPGEEKPGEETPGEENPGEETPGEETPGEETPGEENPGEETPGEETPAVGVTSCTTFTSTENAVRINWTAVEGADGYRVYRLVDGKWKSVKTLGKGDVTTYRDSGLEIGTEYKYKVKAFVRDAEGTAVFGEASTEFAAATKPAAAEIVKVGRAATAVRLYWNKVDCSGYKVQQYDSASKSWKTVKLVSADKDNYRISGLKSGTTYKFRVQAFTRVGEGKAYSKWSATKSAATK